MEEEAIDGACLETVQLNSALVNGIQKELENNQTNRSDTCIDCEEIISAERREFIPGVSRCRNCQQIFDAVLPRVGYSRVSLLSVKADIEKEKEEEEGESEE